MTRQQVVDTIIQLLNKQPYDSKWCEAVRGFGLYLSRRYNNFDIIEFYKSVGYN